MHRLIIDTDPGEDDALAIMMAAAHPNAHMDALTIVAGNVGLEYTTNNAAVVLDQLGLDVPIYPGCTQPFVAPHQNAAYAHGNDGFGNTGYTSSRTIETKHAALAMVERINNAPRELTLVMLGPMTNLATALKLDPTLPYKLKRIVVMAGAVTARGNVNACTEFNVYADPEAASVVFAAWATAGKTIEVADWELTARYGFTQEARATWATLDTDKARFFADISAHSDRFIEAERRRTTQYFADPVAMAVALAPEIVTQRATHYLTIELAGTTTRGQTVVDWQGESGMPANADIIMALNGARLLALVTAGLK